MFKALTITIEVGGARYVWLVFFNFQFSKFRIRSLKINHLLLNVVRYGSGWSFALGEWRV